MPRLGQPLMEVLRVPQQRLPSTRRRQLPQPQHRHSPGKPRLRLLKLCLHSRPHGPLVALTNLWSMRRPSGVRYEVDAPEQQKVPDPIPDRNGKQGPSGPRRSFGGAVLTVVAGIIERDGLILIAQRKPGDRLEHQWEFPGGKVEPGETPQQALVRELREEFAVETEVGAYVGRSVFAYEHVTIELLAYRVRYRSGTFALHDHQAIRWVPIAELDNYQFAPADVPLLRLLQQSQPSTLPE